MLDNTVGNFNTTMTTAVSLEKENTAENDENFSSMQVDQPCLFSDLNEQAVRALSACLEIDNWIENMSNISPINSVTVS